MGHSAIQTMNYIMASYNIPNSNKTQPYFCSAWFLGKIHNFLSPSSNAEYNTPLQLIYTDLWGPSLTPSSNGYRHYIHFIDAATKFT